MMLFVSKAIVPTLLVIGKPVVTSEREYVADGAGDVISTPVGLTVAPALIVMALP